MKFVDRTEEQERLSTAINSKSPSLVVVFGRRRIGKVNIDKKSTFTC